MLGIFALSLRNFETEFVELEKRLAEAQWFPRIIAPPGKSDEADCWTAQCQVDEPDASLARAAARTLTDELGIDLAIISEKVMRSFRPQLAVFDMDSTLVQTEVIDELAKLVGVGPQVSAITASAMRGEIDFQESFRRRVQMLTGLERSVIAQLAQDIPITPGAKCLTAYLQTIGCRTAIVSGGFDSVATRLRKELGIDEAFTNRLAYSQDKVSGVDGEIVDASCKATILEGLAKQYGIAIDETLAVGDGANDVPMLALAGLSVGFRPKPVLREKADLSLLHVGLDGLVPLLTACGTTL